uniref:Uncharacterized protein n=1 Tax=Anguilla anguilla TaxID=7936 RepID=A0A0E9PW60_ANGAN
MLSTHPRQQNKPSGTSRTSLTSN